MDTLNAATILLSNGRELPTLGDTVRVLLSNLDNPHVDLRSIAAIVRRDPIISAKILRFSNSAAAGGHIFCTKVDDAVLRAGVSRLRSIVTSIGVFTAFESHGAKFPMWSYWLSAATMAYVAQHLCDLAGMHDKRDTAFTIGLTQCLGRLTVAHCNADLSRTIMEAAKSRRETYRTAAADQCIDDALVAALLLRTWGMHIEVIDSVRAQIEPWESSPPLTLLGQLAFEICRTGSGTSMPGDFDDQPSIDVRVAMRRLGISESVLPDVQALRTAERDVARSLIEAARG